MDTSLMAGRSGRPVTGASLQQVLVIWRNAMYSERRLELLAYSTLFLVAAIVLGVANFNTADRLTLALFSPALPLTAMAMFHWDRFVIHALKQNPPAIARLVPRQHASMHLAVAMAWLLAVAPGVWLAMGFENGLLISLVWTNYMTGAALMRAGYISGNIVYMGTLVFAILGLRSDELRNVLSQPPVIALLTVLTAAFTWHALRLAFPSGGERHWRILPGQHRPMAPRDLPRLFMNWLGKGAGNPFYAWKLRRDIAGGNTGHLLLHALGPNNHRFDFVIPAAVVAVLILAWWLANGSRPGPLDLFTATYSGCVIGLLVASQIWRHKRFVANMEKTSAEQALVRLAPRAPSAEAMGRVLARALVSISLGEWLAVAVAALAGASLMGPSVMQMAATALACTFAYNGWALRDYSGKDQGSYGRMLLQGLAVVAGGVALFMASAEPVAWSVLAVAVLCVGALIVRDRWRLMLAAPPPFPAGRF